MTFDTHYALGVLAGLALAAMLRACARQMAIVAWDIRSEKLHAALKPGEVIWFRNRFRDGNGQWQCARALSAPHDALKLGGGNFLTVDVGYMMGETSVERPILLGEIFTEPPPCILQRDYPRLTNPIS